MHIVQLHYTVILKHYPTFVDVLVGVFILFVCCLLQTNTAACHSTLVVPMDVLLNRPTGHRLRAPYLHLQNVPEEDAK